MADYSLRHRRDGNAGTTVLYHLRNYRWTLSLSVIDYGPDGAVGGWVPPPLPPGQQDLSGTAGRMKQLAD